MKEVLGRKVAKVQGPTKHLELLETRSRAHLDISIGIQKDVLQLEIPVNDPVLKEEGN